MEHADIFKLWCRFEGHGPAALVLFVRAVEAAERERCTKLCLSRSANGDYRADTREDCAALIRGEWD